MTEERQKIRRSQFIYTYGPGSIMEGINGSRLVPSLEGLKGHCNEAFFKKHELKDIRMSAMLDDKSDFDNHLIVIPANDAVSEGDKPVVYSTAIFPIWHVCYKRTPAVLYKQDFFTYSEEHCQAYDPELCVNCDKENNANVRFIKACPNGHMDDLEWDYLVHMETMKTCEHKDYYYWTETGNSLADIKISCPKCDVEVDMEKVYDYKFKCTSRFPEKEDLWGDKVCFTKIKREFNKCEEYMSIIQKQSTSLRLADTKTLLKIPQFDEPVLDSFNNRSFKERINTIKEFNIPITKDQILADGLTRLSPSDSKKLKEYLDDHDVEELLTISDTLGNRKPHYCNAVDEEFESLKSTTMKESANFSKQDFLNYELKLSNCNFPLEVCAVNKLTTVTAQLSYQRKPHSKESKSGEILEPEPIDIGYEINGAKWYPAYKGVGEGIFIHSPFNPITSIPGIYELANKWEKANPDVAEIREEVKSPIFVWWHTLAHALIKSLSLSCGYSSASLRERVYVDVDVKSFSDGTGGILIYNTSPGDDSGMGGLTDLVHDYESFNKVLNNALHTLQICSNDPLCSSVHIVKNSVNGAACHNCLLISETSCEHQNTLLDRHFFI